jgi:hypothetical protein
LRRFSECHRISEVDRALRVGEIVFNDADGHFAYALVEVGQPLVAEEALACRDGLFVPSRSLEQMCSPHVRGNAVVAFGAESG